MKLFKFAVTTVLLSTCLAISASAENMFSEEDLQRYENNIGFLNEIGVMEYSDNITRTVTRGEFAKVLTALNGTGASVSGVSAFTDVTDTTEYADYINTVASLGFMNGYGGGLFGAEDTLTYEQAVYGLVRVLGYGGIVENNIASYSSQASQLGLYDSTYGGGNYPITYGSLSIMVMNTLEANYLEYDINDKSTSPSDDTLLEKIFDLERYTGVVTSTSVTSLNSADGVGKNNIEIDNEVYYCEVPSDDYLGYTVDYYVDSEDEAVYFTKHLSKNEDFTINAEQIENYANRAYTYKSSNGRNKIEKIPSGCSVIYNGRAITGEADIDMHIKNGELLFIDNNKDGDWDVVKITDIKAMVVGVVNTEDYTIRDKFDRRNILDLQDAYDNEMLTLKNYQGLACEIDDISEGNVISIIMSADGQIAEVHVSKTKKNGSVERYAVDEFIQVGGEEFPIRGGELTGDVAERGKGTLYVDVFGYGIYFERTSTGMSYGYVTKVFEDPAYETYGIKIYDFDTATLKSFFFDTKVTVDGIGISNPDSVVSELREGEMTKPQIIGYSLNTDSEINKMDTLAYNEGKEAEGTLRLHTTSTSGVGYRNEMSCFRDGKTFTNASTKFIKIPSAGESMGEEDFMIFSTSDLSNDGKYKFTSYLTGENKLSADYVLMTSTDNLTIFGIVKDTRLTVDDDGEEMYEVNLYTQSGSLITVYAERDYIEKAPAYNTGSGSYRIEKGDVISYLVMTDANGESKVQDAQIIFDYDEDGDSRYLGGSNPYINWGSSGVNFYCGNVYSRESNLIGMTDDALEGEVPEYTTDQLQLMTLDRGTVFKMQEGRKNEVVAGKTSEILDYESAGEEHSKVFVYLASLVVRMIYIYD